VSKQGPLVVKVANNNVMNCTLELPNAQWYVQELSFNSTIKVLPLPYYDLILGMDWLDQFNPMYID
jgi:hypothetical protein